MRISILGYSGSGKSTLAKQVALLCNIPVLHLDTVQFEANWKERNRDEARAIVADFMSQENWIIDGNYTGFFQSERLEQSDYIIYLHFSRFKCLWRAYNRFLKYRNTTREDMADGCTEKMDLEFAWWILYKGRDSKKRKHYKNILDKYKDKATVIKNQKQLDELLDTHFGYTEKATG